MKVVLPLGGSAVCFILAWVSFHYHETGTGWIFVGLGLVVFVIGLAFGNKSE